MDTDVSANETFPRGFKDVRELTRWLEWRGTPPIWQPYLLTSWFQGLWLLRRKENTSRSTRTWTRVLLCCHILSTVGRRNINHLTFRAMQQSCTRPVLRSPLGPANPCTNPVHMETFSTSVFNIRSWIVATTTKICTRCNFIEIYIPKCVTTSAPSYTVEDTISHDRSTIGRSLQRHPFSGLVHSAGELLHTP